MPVQKRKRATLKSASRRAVGPKRITAAKRNGRAGIASRKVFTDRSLLGALPGMGEWAFPLLNELRDE